MGRINDEGPYDVDSIEIISATDNFRQAMDNYYSDRNYWRHRPDDRNATGGRENDPAGIAAGLNGQRIPTSRGAGDWTGVQVMRVLKRIA